MFSLVHVFRRVFDGVFFLSTTGTSEVQPPSATSRQLGRSQISRESTIAGKNMFVFGWLEYMGICGRYYFLLHIWTDLLMTYSYLSKEIDYMIILDYMGQLMCKTQIAFFSKGKGWSFTRVLHVGPDEVFFPWIDWFKARWIQWSIITRCIVDVCWCILHLYDYVSNMWYNIISSYTTILTKT